MNISKDDQRPVYIYTLSEPGRFEVRYVGSTIEPKKRLYYHQHSPCSELLKEWIDDLRGNGKKPHLLVIDIASSATREDVELKWARHFLAIGYPLLNVAKNEPLIKQRGEAQRKANREAKERFWRAWGEYFRGLNDREKFARMDRDKLEGVKTIELIEALAETYK